MKAFQKAALIALLLALAVLNAAAFDMERMQSTLSKQTQQGRQSVLSDWQKLVQGSGNHSELARLRQTNDFFNQRIRFGDDSTIWGQSDYWATPIETIGKGWGDCEDFAIAKYFTLLSAGIPDDKLRLIYVQARTGGSNGSATQAHMVLAFYATPDAEPLVMDNLISDIQPASRRADLTPVFSFNSQGVWQGVSGARGGGGTANLTRWQDLLKRARLEGFDALRTAPDKAP